MRAIVLGGVAVCVASVLVFFLRATPLLDVENDDDRRGHAVAAGIDVERDGASRNGAGVLPRDGDAVAGSCRSMRSVVREKNCIV
jgi:hypothetical protein